MMQPWTYRQRDGQMEGHKHTLTWFLLQLLLQAVFFTVIFAGLLCWNDFRIVVYNSQVQSTSLCRRKLNYIHFYQGCQWIRIGADNVLWTDTDRMLFFRSNICLCFLSPDWHNLTQTSHPLPLGVIIQSIRNTHLLQSVELTHYSIHRG